MGSWELESSSRGRLLPSVLALETASESLVESETMLSLVSSLAMIGVDGLSRESSVNDDLVSSSSTVADLPFSASWLLSSEASSESPFWWTLLPFSVGIPRINLYHENYSETIILLMKTKVLIQFCSHQMQGWIT